MLARMSMRAADHHGLIESFGARMDMAPGFDPRGNFSAPCRVKERQRLLSWAVQAALATTHNSPI